MLKKEDKKFFVWKIIYKNEENKIEDDLIQLTINLIECASFFNELGDEFKLTYFETSAKEGDNIDYVFNFAAEKLLEFYGSQNNELNLKRQMNKTTELQSHNFKEIECPDVLKQRY